MNNGGYNALIKQKYMESIWNKMDDSERIAFAIASLQNSNHQETMKAISDLSDKVDKSKHSWVADFGANIAGNAVFDGGMWLLSRVFRKLI